MDGTLSATGTTLHSIPRTLRRSTAAGQSFGTQLPLLRSRRITTTTNTEFQRSSAKLCCKSPLFNWSTAAAAVSPVRCRLHCVSSSADSFASSSGADDVSPLSPDVIVLDVKAQVSSASVNLTTETAIVWPMSEVKVAPDWQKVIGEELAKNLTNCGFTSNLRGEAASEVGSS